MEKKSVSKGIISAAVILIIIGCSIFWFRRPVKPREKLPGEWESFTVQINRELVTFPCDYETLVKLSHAEYTSQNMSSEIPKRVTGYSVPLYQSEIKSSVLHALVTNHQLSAVDLESSSPIHGIQSGTNSEEAGITIIFPGGIRVGAPLATVLEQYGEPDGQWGSSYSSGIRCEWENEEGICSIVFDRNDRVESMKIEYQQWESLAAFKNPAIQMRELDESLETGTIQIGDTVLTFPCTYADFEKTGLQHETFQADTLLGICLYDLEYIIDESENKMKVYVLNNTGKQAPFSECLIIGAALLDSIPDVTKNFIVLPGGIQIGSTEQEILEQYGEPEQEELFFGGKLLSWFIGNAEGPSMALFIRIDDDTGEAIAFSILAVEDLN